VSLRRIALITYFTASVAMFAAVLLLLGALLSSAAGQEQYRALCIDGVLLGASLSVIVLGVRSIVSVVHWMKNKSENAHV
jgi:hypothetical protein